MWNKRRSLLLSKVSTVLFMVVVLGIMVAAPWVINYIFASANRTDNAIFLPTIYVGGVLALIVLVLLYRLLHNIGLGKVFTANNTRLLRQISWLCFFGGIVCVVSALYYFPWLIAGAAAAFIGLIVRVVKNVIAEAIALKEENDFTI